MPSLPARAQSGPRPSHRQSDELFGSAVQFVLAETLRQQLVGRGITIRFRKVLRNHCGDLLFTGREGLAVHGAAFPKLRLIFLESALQHDLSELRRILTHELFHFVWIRLGNPRRLLYEQLLREECDRGARGELGWSAELQKRRLEDGEPTRSRRWREYCCESFCDTAAWYFCGQPKHDEVTLSQRWRARRGRWFRTHIDSGTIRF